MRPHVNPYAVLGAHAAMTDEQLRRQYRAAARAAHPDMTRRDTTSEFTGVGVAYGLVKDAVRRTALRNAMLLEGYAPCDACSGTGARPMGRWLACCTPCNGLGLLPPGAPSAGPTIRKIGKRRHR